jgi:hypothetical protein
MAKQYKMYIYLILVSCCTNTNHLLIARVSSVHELIDNVTMATRTKMCIN